MTMIELVIGVVLFGIAGAIVFGVIMQGLTGSDASRAGGISDAAVARTADALGDDVSRTVTPDNRSGIIRDEAGFAEAVRRNQVVYRPAVRGDGTVDTNANPVRADIDDVRQATPTMLQLIVDDECITWRSAPGNRDGRATIDLTRSVAPATNCNATSSTKRYLSAEASAPGFDRTPFSYQLICNPAVCPGSRAAGGTPCRPFVETGTVRADQRRWIVGVDVGLVALTGQGGQSGAANSTISQTIRSRDIETYREALGC